jgi:2-polyprenyl-3-methyl-5-hydroxy-6-metoxy-1,4-benzoquinol methylase
MFGGSGSHIPYRMMNDLSAARKRIEFISEPASVNMAEDWFEIATADHFWIRRRFDVVRNMLRGCDLSEWRVAEVGCGHGLVQRQFEQGFGVAVDGFELNLVSLEQNLSTRGRLLHYNVLEKRPEFRARYDLVLLFDVLEHIEREAQFLDAITFLVKEGGQVLINVPALQGLYSQYDRRAGHLRRYSLRQLVNLVSAHGLQVRVCTYWGLPLLPFLWVRKQHLRFVRSENVIRRGFDPGSKLVNEGMYLLSLAEPIPQSFWGTSAMLLARKSHEPKRS